MTTKKQIQLKLESLIYLADKDAIISSETTIDDIIEHLRVLISYLKLDIEATKRELRSVMGNR